MQHIESSYWTYAKGSCYRCGATSDLVDLDVHIDGEGALCICTTCILQAAQLAKIGRAKMRRAAREMERAAAHRDRNDDGPDAVPPATVADDLTVIS